MHDGDTMLFHTIWEGGFVQWHILQSPGKSPNHAPQTNGALTCPMDIDEQVFHESKQGQLE